MKIGQIQAVLDNKKMRETEIVEKVKNKLFKTILVEIDKNSNVENSV